MIASGSRHRVQLEKRTMIDADSILALGTVNAKDPFKAGKFANGPRATTRPSMAR